MQFGIRMIWRRVIGTAMDLVEVAKLSGTREVVFQVRTYYSVHNRLLYQFQDVQTCHRYCSAFSRSNKGSGTKEVVF